MPARTASGLPLGPGARRRGRVATNWGFVAFKEFGKSQQLCSISGRHLACCARYELLFLGLRFRFLLGGEKVGNWLTIDARERCQFDTLDLPTPCFNRRDS